MALRTAKRLQQSRAVRVLIRRAFSAKGAISIPAWGDAPGIRLSDKQALKARLNRVDVFYAGVSRVFSAGDFCDAINSGALPQARCECCAFGALTNLVFFAFVFFRYHTIIHGVGMEHYRAEVKEKKAETPSGRCERS